MYTTISYKHIHTRSCSSRLFQKWCMHQGPPQFHDIYMYMYATLCNYHEVHLLLHSAHTKAVTNTLSNVLRSYNFNCRESIPAAKMSPSGSKLATGGPLRCIRPWQLGERRSHRRMVRSREPERKVSLMGDIIRFTTLYMYIIVRQVNL